MEFRILGPLSVIDDGKELELGAAKQRTLLVLLLLHRNEAVTSERLTDWLWQGKPPATAQKSLQVYVSGLRKALGDGRLETHGRSYLLHVEPAELDLDRFEQLLDQARDREPKAAATLFAEALDLYRGEPLVELRYEQVAQAEIARLEELRLQALEERIDADLACGRERVVLPELEALVASYPLRERLRGQLMLALYRTGRQADALAVYRQGREQLDEQLGLDPGPELRELERRILEHDPELGASSRTILRRRPTRRRRLVALLAGGALLLVAAIAAGVVELTGSRAVGGIARVAPESVGVLDARTDRFVAQVAVPGRPSLIAVDGPVAWVASDQSQTITPVSLGRLSPGSAVVPGVTPTGMVASRGVVWVVDAIHRKVVKIIGSYGTPSPAISLPATRHPTLSPVGAVAVGAGSVWVTDGSTDLLRLNPRTGSWSKIPLGVPLFDVAVGDGAVWAVSPQGEKVVEVGMRSGKLEARVPITAHPGLSKPLPVAVAVGAGAVWVLNANDASVTRIDPKLQAVTSTTPLGAARTPNSIAAGAGAAWVANTGDGTLARIDARTNALTSIDVASAPIGVAVAGSKVLVSVQPGFVTTTSSVGGNTIRSVPGALPPSFCSPVYYQGKGKPSLLIAADLPFEGLTSEDQQSNQVRDAIRFVLARNNYKAGRYTVGYQVCDDATAAGVWSKAACRRNARAYTNSPLLIGVVGPSNSGCVQQELPILNNTRPGPIATISGSATTAWLTRAGPADPPGEPARLYPTGVRNFARVIANDATQASADMTLAKQLGSKRLYILNDGFDPYGPGIAADARQAAQQLGLTVAGYRAWNYAAQHYLTLAGQIKRAHADTVFLGGVLDANGNTVIRDLRAVLGAKLRIIADDGFAYFPDLVQATGPAAEGMYVSNTVAPNNRLPPAGKRFVASFDKAIGSSTLGYSVTSAQSAQVLLNAIAASDGTRTSVTNHLLRAKITNGILGSFHFDANGDTTAGHVTIYQIVNGKPVIRQIISQPPA